MRGLAAAGLVTAIAAFGTFAARADQPRAAPEIYADKCVYCHDARGWGTRVLARRVPEGQAELLERKDLPPQFTQMVVRRGIGSMPPFTPTDLSDAEIERLARWLEELN